MNQQKLKKAAQYTVSKASEALEKQRLRFYIRDLQKQKQCLHQKIGMYVEDHEDINILQNQQLKEWLFQLQELQEKMQQIDGPNQKEDYYCSTCGSYVHEHANFCENCGQRIG